MALYLSACNGTDLMIELLLHGIFGMLQIECGCRVPVEDWAFARNDEGFVQCDILSSY
jgi:hypothetical protein